jgi:hypothetical protein
MARVRQTHRRYVSSHFGRRGQGAYPQPEPLPVNEALDLAVEALREQARGDADKVLAAEVLAAHRAGELLPDGMRLSVALWWGSGAVMMRYEECSGERWKAAQRTMSRLLFGGEGLSELPRPAEEPPGAESEEDNGQGRG